MIFDPVPSSSFLVHRSVQIMYQAEQTSYNSHWCGFRRVRIGPPGTNLASRVTEKAFLS